MLSLLSLLISTSPINGELLYRRSMSSAIQSKIYREIENIKDQILHEAWDKAAEGQMSGSWFISNDTCKLVNRQTCINKVAIALRRIPYLNVTVHNSDEIKLDWNQE